MQSYLDMMQGPVRVVFTVPELSSILMFLFHTALDECGVNDELEYYT